MPQFDTSTFTSQIFWLIITFGTLYLIVHYYIVPTAEQIFNKRQNSLKNEFETAQKLTNEIETLKQIYNKELKQIYIKAENNKKEALAVLEENFTEKKLNLKIELEKVKQSSDAETHQLIQSFLQDKPEACIKLAGFIIEKILNQKPDYSVLNECYRKVE